MIITTMSISDGGKVTCSTTQLDRSTNAEATISENSGQIAVGKYVVQIGSIHGGVVNIAMPDEQPHWQPRLAPVLLRPRRFTGLLDRKVETSAATAAVHAAQPVEFYGSAGLGKTSLLRHLAYDLPNTSCADGVVYLSAHQQPVADLLQFLFEAFYESNIPAKSTEAQIRHALQGKRALILLDDIDLARNEVEALLDAAPQCIFVLASSERRLWGEGRVLALCGLPPDDALTLIEREIGRPLAGEELSATTQLCQLLAGHPLRLLQVAAVAREQGQSLVEITRWLQQEIPTEALTTQLLGSLSPSERRVMGTLAVFGSTPLYHEHLAALTGLSDLTSVVRVIAPAQSGAGSQPALQPQRRPGAALAPCLGFNLPGGARPQLFHSLGRTASVRLPPSAGRSRHPSPDVGLGGRG